MGDGEPGGAGMQAAKVRVTFCAMRRLRRRERREAEFEALAALKVKGKKERWRCIGRCCAAPLRAARSSRRKPTSADRSHRRGRCWPRNSNLC